MNGIFAIGTAQSIKLVSLILKKNSWSHPSALMLSQVVALGVFAQ